jgi:PDZ domain-containing protein
MKHLFSVAFLMLTASACVTPSTMLVNREGKVIRCASYGYGWGVAGAIAIGTAEQMHDSCVRDAGMIGFIPVPKAAFGFNVDTKTSPLRIIQVGSNAAAAGMRIGDVLLNAGSRPLNHPFDLFQFLNSKKPGDRVVVTVQRDQTIVTLNFQLITRQAGILDAPVQQTSDSQSTPGSQPIAAAALPGPEQTSKSDVGQPSAQTESPPAQVNKGIKNLAQLFLIKGPVVTTPPQVLTASFCRTEKPRSFCLDGVFLLATSNSSECPSPFRPNINSR